jgi:hypothetical protein
VDKSNFKDRLTQLLGATLDEGPGPRFVAREVADVLTTFIFNEAGAYAPQAIDRGVCHNAGQSGGGQQPGAHAGRNDVHA